jgi:hypothetical protein
MSQIQLPGKFDCILYRFGQILEIVALASFLEAPCLCYLRWKPAVARCGKFAKGTVITKILTFLSQQGQLQLRELVAKVPPRPWGGSPEFNIRGS